MKFHAEHKLFLLSRAPKAKRILGRIIADGFDNDEHPENVALKYMTEAQKHLSTLTKRGRIAHAMERIVGRLPNLGKQEKGRVIGRHPQIQEGVATKISRTNLAKSSHQQVRC